MPELRALFVHDTWYAASAQGHVYAYGAFAYTLWRDRFLSHFSHIHVIGREAAYDESARDLDRSDGPGVSFTLLPNINAPLKRIVQSRAIYRRIAAEAEKVDAVIVRGPAEFGMMAARAARRQGKPLAIEMSGCAFDHTWYHGGLIARLYAPVKYLRCRHMVRRAESVIYVTQHFLQRRYPARGHTETASNVEIDAPDAGVLDKRLERLTTNTEKLVIGMIGNIGNRLKGFDIALQALSKVQAELPPFEFRVLGQGRRDDWADRIQYYGLNDNVILDGTCQGGEPVLAWLDHIDVYIHPSFHEGLPRSLIEAMSRGLPALASNAGGTGELLPETYIHQRGDVDTLARQLVNLAGDTTRRAAAARDNFATAQNYSRDVLKPRRERFWARFAQLARERAGR